MVKRVSHACSPRAHAHSVTGASCCRPPARPTCSAVTCAAPCRATAAATSCRSRPVGPSGRGAPHAQHPPPLLASPPCRYSRAGAAGNTASFTAAQQPPSRHGLRGGCCCADWSSDAACSGCPTAGSASRTQRLARQLQRGAGPGSTSHSAARARWPAAASSGCGCGPWRGCACCGSGWCGDGWVAEAGQLAPGCAVLGPPGAAGNSGSRSERDRGV